MNENAFYNVICKMAAILSLPKCVNRSPSVIYEKFVYPIVT